MYRHLHLRVEVLHPETQPVEAQLAQVRQARRGGGARVDLDRDFRIGLKPETRPQVLHQAGQFVVGQEGRRAAAEMQLRHRDARPQFLHMQRDFLRQRIQVTGGALVMPSHHLVTGAVVTDRIAEWDVHVQRQGLVRRDGTPLLQRLPVILFAEAAVVAVCRGIRGVARPVLVQPGQQLGREKGLGGGGSRRF
ncbi:hypothetical protein D3C71_1587850 [compost metagenome]